MSDTKQDGGPAFPSTNEIDLGGMYSPGHAGMSLRDWLAGQALAGLCANPIIAERCQDRPDDVAGAAFECADAMLKAMEK